ncbi:ROK family protein [Corallococcus carmarthensis]|uniref:ROK family protein n=1 Tax=Corallococcus carmarthensis TaxID=2316728 RepID=A0A3A8JYC1_9BACT|nr:ROK family protein [Corallococcus carmarthensis]NOK20491.1 ROK family protein [Corallococcus carmarthensis]RKH00968.1 ROK family protein [Corallococcus carmarthensis]
MADTSTKNGRGATNGQPADRARVWGGIDLGGTKIEAVVVDARGEVLGRARHPTPAKGGPGEVVKELYGALGEAAQTAGIEPAKLAGVGVGAAGAVDANSGTLAHTSNVAGGWDAPYPLASDLGDLVGGSKVVLGNDVQVAVAAEYKLGAGRNYRSVLGVWWGTGVGGGLVLNGVPWRGQGSAGEIGHMVVKPNGARCGCGRNGCLEAYAGRACMESKARAAAKKGEKTLLFDIMREKKRTRLSSGVWARALKDKDPLATRLIDRAIEMLGTTIASVINLLDVEAIVLGGGLGSRLGPLYMGRIQDAMHPHLFITERKPAMHIAELGDLSGAIGAALLAGPQM